MGGRGEGWRLLPAARRGVVDGRPLLVHGVDRRGRGRCGKGGGGGGVGAGQEGATE